MTDSKEKESNLATNRLLDLLRSQQVETKPPPAERKEQGAKEVEEKTAVKAAAPEEKPAKTAPEPEKETSGDSEPTAKSILKVIPAVGWPMIKVGRAVEEVIKKTFFPGLVFEELGVKYIGPVQGHSLGSLIEVFEKARKYDRPVLIHCVTQKGRGYSHAQSNPERFHGTGPFDVKTGSLLGQNEVPTYSSVFGKTAVRIARKDSRIVAITAAMPDGTGLRSFAGEFPDRFFDVGIAEQHAVNFASGLALSGLKPIVAIYSTFLQRAYDQIYHDVCLMDIPILFVLDRSGIVSDDGPTHQGINDIVYLRHMPHMIVMSPKDENELQHMIKSGLLYSHPTAIRFPKGKGFGVPLDTDFKEIPLGRSELLKEGQDLILAFGSMVYPALGAAQRLEKEGISLAVVNARFAKPLDRDMILLKVKMPVGTSLDETNRVVSMVENLLAQEPSVEIITANVGSQAEEDPADLASGFSASGPHEAMIWVGLMDKEKRDLSDLEITEKIRKKLPHLKDIKFEAQDLGRMMMGGAESPVDIKIYGKDLDILKEIAENIVDRIKDVEGLRDITHSLARGRPEYQIKVDREKASRLGLMVSQIGNTVQAATLGKVASRYREAGEELDIRVRYQKRYRDSQDDILSIPIMTPLKQFVYLGQVATIKQGEGPVKITRENQSRRVSVTANIAGRDLGSIVKDIKKRIADVEKNLPSGYFMEFGGEYEQMQDAFLIMAGAFALATLLVYMIMASQFESFKHPFVIMFTIPLALIGVVLALLISGKPISLAVLIGFIMLGGIAVNNGIVMVDYINQLKRKGLDKKQAILEACSVRLRPVLITAFTTILGMMPMALSTSSGAEMRAPMAITVIGGLVATTFLTLFVIPVIYSLVERVRFKEAGTRK